MYPVNTEGSIIDTLVYSPTEFLLGFIEAEDQDLCIIQTNSTNRMQTNGCFFLLSALFCRI